VTQLLPATPTVAAAQRRHPVKRALEAIDNVVKTSERTARAQLDPVVAAASDVSAAAVVNVAAIVTGG